MAKEAGRIIVSDPGSDKPLLEYGMVQCVHCGGQFPQPRFDLSPQGKATRNGRGFCFNCNGYICGAGCQECVPTEQMIENVERGRPENYRPIIVPVS